MKKLLILTLVFSSVLLDAKEDWNYKNYFRSDSALIYSWNAVSLEWMLNSVQLYSYSDNKIAEVLVKEYGTRNNVSKTNYLYGPDGQLSELDIFIWQSGWVPSSRYIYTYAGFNQYDSIYLQIWKSNSWTNNRIQKKYKYDIDGKLLEFQMIYWVNNSWSTPTTDFSTYDEQGRLIKRVAIYTNGKTDYQIIYNYDDNGLRAETYAQYPSGATWANWWFINYQYDNCSQQQSQIQYTGVLTSWVPSTKTVIFNSFKTDLYPGKKLPVCHNGHTIYISKNALKAHLAHGDCIGECTVEKTSDNNENDDKGDEITKPPFKVYPNPATDRISIRFDNEGDHNSEQRRIELTDFYGKLIKSFNFKGNGDLTIYREGLISGKYYIRLVGKEGFSLMVIFK